MNEKIIFCPCCSSKDVKSIIVKKGFWVQYKCNYCKYEFIKPKKE